MATIKFYREMEYIEAEAKAMSLIGIQIAKEVGLYPLIVEYDAMNVVKLVKGEKEIQKEIYYTVFKIQDLILDK